MKECNEKENDDNDRKIKERSLANEYAQQISECQSNIF